MIVSHFCLVVWTAHQLHPTVDERLVFIRRRNVTLRLYRGHADVSGLKKSVKQVTGPAPILTLSVYRRRTLPVVSWAHTCHDDTQAAVNGCRRRREVASAVLIRFWWSRAHQHLWAGLSLTHFLYTYKVKMTSGAWNCPLFRRGSISLNAAYFILVLSLQMNLFT